MTTGAHPRHCPGRGHGKGAHPGLHEPGVPEHFPGKEAHLLLVPVRQELWLKGETSGNYQHIVELRADCDKDALLVRVKKDGPACHLGTDSCFDGNPFMRARKIDMEEQFSYEGLYQLLQERNARRPEGSYTTYLFEKGLDKILKKVGEECTEVIIAAKAEDHKETVYEIADLAYHVMVLMVQAGISLDEVKAELASRHVIDHKVKQEKMASDLS